MKTTLPDSTVIPEGTDAQLLDDAAHKPPGARPLAVHPGSAVAPSAAPAEPRRRARRRGQQATRQKATVQRPACDLPLADLIDPARYHGARRLSDDLGLDRMELDEAARKWPGTRGNRSAGLYVLGRDVIAWIEEHQLELTVDPGYADACRKVAEMKRSTEEARKSGSLEIIDNVFEKIEAKRKQAAEQEEQKRRTYLAVLGRIKAGSAGAAERNHLLQFAEENELTRQQVEADLANV